MRKTVYIIATLLLFNCTQKNNLRIENFPTIILQTGIEKELDISKYVTDYSKISVGHTDGIEAIYDEENATLKLNADGTVPYVVLPLQIDNNSV